MFAEGGLFSTGDGHGVQGDGEVNLTALETSLSGTFRFTVRKDMKLNNPRAETATHWITHGFDPDLDDAAKEALRDMIRLITAKTGLSRRRRLHAVQPAGRPARHADRRRQQGHPLHDRQEADRRMKLRTFLCALLLVFAGTAGPALARDELVTTAHTAGGETIPYILTSKPGTPAYAVILMPGGQGRVNPRMMDGKLVFSAGGNFLIRSRELFADGRFVAVSTDATSTPDRMLAIIRDLQARYGQIAIYIIGTSRSTEATMALARPLDGWAAGFVHTSSMNGIAGFDPRGLKSRQLIVLHVRDACRLTSPSAGAASHASTAPS